MSELKAPFKPRTSIRAGTKDRTKVRARTMDSVWDWNLTAAQGEAKPESRPGVGSGRLRWYMPFGKLRGQVYYIY